MALEPGTRFGSYEVAEIIGSGGMGEVYRATDTSLKRDVALKVLPEAFVADRDRLARFQREAEILASLNQTNIAQVYGLESAGGQTAIVMELVEGPTLADRIKAGPIPPDEAMGVALQVASALEAAHASQIVHRDLKPANVKIKEDGTVKVLDFGISKPIDAKAISGGSPVMTTPAVTQTGVILGTAAYMSPEQARGRPVDQRTDIWAFGCLLFEMLTGQPAFGGEDVMLTLARVLDRDTDLSSIPSTISPAVRHTIKLCLQKDPRKRVADIRDVRLALEGAFETDLPRDSQAAVASRRPLQMATVALLALLVGAAAIWILKPVPQPPSGMVTRFDYDLPDGVGFRNQVTSVLDIAPSGTFFAFNGSDGLYVRQMGDVESRLINGTGGQVLGVEVSPDGRELAYVRGSAASGQLVKIAVGGGSPIVLADPIGNPFGLSWESDGTILYGQPDGIWRVSEDGGTPVHVIETEEGEQAYGPHLLPGGEWLLFTLARTSGANRWNEADIVVESLTTHERRVLRTGGTDARYVPTGHITYVLENVLFASAFDPKTLELGAERVSLIQGVQTAALSGVIGGSGFYSMSDNGTLVYLPGSVGTSSARPERSLVWVDRQGNVETLPVRPDDYTTARISPDGTKVALVVGSTLPATDPAADIYIYDLKTESLTQLTFNPEGDDGPVWSTDSSRIFFRSYHDGDGAVYSIPADGGTAELVGSSATNPNPEPWSISSDGKTLLLIQASSGLDTDLATLDLGNSDQVMPLLDDNTFLLEPSLSPNGQWLAYYHTDEPGGPPAIDVRPYPDVTQQRRPIIDAGLNPVFSADGSEIFFVNGDAFSSVAVQYDPFRIGIPQTLFRGQYWYGVAGPSGALGRAWDADPSGDRFLMITVPGTGAPSGDGGGQAPISVVLNWFEELKDRVPAE